MGSGSSKTAELATEIARLHDEMVKHYKILHRHQYSLGVANLLFYCFIVFLLGWSILRVYWNWDDSIMNILKSISKTEVVIFSIGASIWALVTAFIKSAHCKRLQKIKDDRCKRISMCDKYEEDSQIDRIRKTLRKAGKELSLLDWSISQEDFGVRSAASPRNSIFTRISEAISGDGPDRRYALICPACRHHNGLVDKYEIPNLKYKCRHCKKWVTATDVVVKRKKEAPTVTRETFENMENLVESQMNDREESSSEDSE